MAILWIPKRTTSFDHHGQQSYPQASPHPAHIKDSHNSPSDPAVPAPVMPQQSQSPVPPSLALPGCGSCWITPRHESCCSRHCLGPMSWPVPDLAYVHPQGSAWGWCCPGALSCPASGWGGRNVVLLPCQLSLGSPDPHGQHSCPQLSPHPAHIKGSAV